MELTELEKQKAESRLAKLKKEGMDLEDAKRLVEELRQRDRGAHDLRICLECSRYARGKCSQTKQQPLRFTLQRCPNFALRGKHIDQNQNQMGD